MIPTKRNNARLLLFYPLQSLSPFATFSTNSSFSPRHQRLEEQISKHQIQYSTSSSLSSPSPSSSSSSSSETSNKVINFFQRRKQPNIITYTAMMASYLRHGYYKQVFELYDQLQENGFTPNAVHFHFALAACFKTGSLTRAKRIHEILKMSNIIPNALNNDLIRTYGKCGELEEAQKIFQTIKQPNIITINVMMSAYIKNGLYKEALELFYQHQAKGLTPDETTFCCALAACVNKDSLTQVQQIHKMILMTNIRTNFLTTMLIATYRRCGLPLKKAAKIKPSQKQISTHALQ
jgi:pentatricopeptide repeat protein